MELRDDIDLICESPLPYGPAKSFKDLRVWQDSMLLAKLVYQHARRLPSDERYGLAAQLKRSAVSVPSNIAEGYGRNNRGEYIQFLGFALGSLAELETQVILASELFSDFGDPEIDAHLNRVGKMLTRLKQSLQAGPATYRSPPSP
jgi:four helix bundle protein